MKSKEIAKNLRDHANEWCPYKYHNSGKYCVIGLKLHEMGVRVETWSEGTQSAGITGFGQVCNMPTDAYMSLSRLQALNDGSYDVHMLIAQLETEPEIDYPLEQLANILKQEMPDVKYYQKI